jgi:hypothetical protein
MQWYMFLQYFLNVLAQIASTMGLQKKCFLQYYFMTWHLKGEIAEPGRQGLRWLHAITKEPRKACPPHTFRRYANRATAVENVISHHPHQQRNCVFCWAFAESVSRESKRKPEKSPSLESIVKSSEVDRQADRPVRVWGCCDSSLWRGRRRRSISQCCKSLGSKAKFVVRKLRGSEDVKPCNTEAKVATGLEAVTRQRV